jgi:hypothetical protein
MSNQLPRNNHPRNPPRFSSGFSQLSFRLDIDVLALQTDPGPTSRPTNLISTPPPMDPTPPRAPYKPTSPRVSPPPESSLASLFTRVVSLAPMALANLPQDLPPIPRGTPVWSITRPCRSRAQPNNGILLPRQGILMILSGKCWILMMFPRQSRPSVNMSFRMDWVD